MQKSLQHMAVNSSRLGFGCARLPGSFSAGEAVNLLDCALDNGITHFDTARMYGNGAADTLLGAVASRRRPEMVIFGKAGITPAPLRVRALRRAMGAPAEPKVKQFSPAQIRASVETSLRNLRTEYLDALLLHEIGAEDANDDLREVLEELRRHGKILRWGVATSVQDCQDLLADHADLCGVIQAPSGWLDQERLVPAETMVIVHSVLKPALGRIETSNADVETTAKLRAAGVDTHDNEAMSLLLLQSAMRRNPNGVTLFSTARREHLILNAALLNEPANDTQIEALEEFVRASA